MATVLVVDDEYGIAELIEAVLTDEGHAVMIAVNGKQGFEILVRQKPDLVFLDYMMPVMDGAAMLRLMAQNAAVSTIPVILMSSVPEATVAKHCAGYTAFMRKPFRITEVIAFAGQHIAQT